MVADKVDDDAAIAGDNAGRLVSRNVRIHNRRTSIRLEPEMWDALSEVAALEKCSIHDLCSAVYDMKGADTAFTGALRLFLMEYFRSAAKNGRNASRAAIKRIKDQSDN